MTTNIQHSSLAQKLISAFYRLDGIHGGLLGLRLDPPTRQRLSGGLLSIGTDVVYSVADALIRKPDLFPDAPMKGAKLLAIHHEALAWRLLRNRFRDMAQLADDAYLTAESCATDQALSYVKANLDPPFALADIVAPDKVPLRNIFLMPAMVAWVGYYQDLLARRTRKKEKAATEMLLASPATPQGMLSAQPLATPQLLATPSSALPSSPVYKMLGPSSVPPLATGFTPEASQVFPAPGSLPPRSRQKQRAELDLRAHDRGVIRHKFERVLRAFGLA